MAAKRAVFSGGGGILNGSDGVILDYQITTDPKVFETSGEYFYNVLTIQEDGKDRVTVQPLFMGGTPANFTVSADGHQLTKDGEEGFIGRKSANSDFTASFERAQEEAGETDIGAAEDTGDDRVIDFTPLIGARCRFEQMPLSEAELAELKKAGKKTYRQDRKDPSKKWPLTKTVVTRFYGRQAVKAAGKPTGKSSTVAKGGKPNGAAVDIAALAQEAVVSILGDAKNNSLKLSALSTKVLQHFMNGPLSAHKNAIATFVSDEDNLSQMEGIEYNAKSEVVSLEG